MSERDVIEMDCLVVGAGPAGLAAALRFQELAEADGAVVVKVGGTELLMTAYMSAEEERTVGLGGLGRDVGYPVCLHGAPVFDHRHDLGR